MHRTTLLHLLSLNVQVAALGTVLIIFTTIIFSPMFSTWQLLAPFLFLGSAFVTMCHVIAFAFVSDESIDRTKFEKRYFIYFPVKNL